jgi:hypothetical protein
MDSGTSGPVPPPSPPEQAARRSAKAIVPGVERVIRIVKDLQTGPSCAERAMQG